MVLTKFFLLKNIVWITNRKFHRKVLDSRHRKFLIFSIYFDKNSTAVLAKILCWIVSIYYDYNDLFERVIFIGHNSFSLNELPFPRCKKLIPESCHTIPILDCNYLSPIDWALNQIVKVRKKVWITTKN